LYALFEKQLVREDAKLEAEEKERADLEAAFWKRRRPISRQLWKRRGLISRPGSSSSSGANTRTALGMD
jgi:hypothetical protein